MAMSTLKSVVAVGMFGLSLTACKPADTPPDLVKTQREALEKAKGVEQQMQQRMQEQIKTMDDAQK